MKRVVRRSAVIVTVMVGAVGLSACDAIPMPDVSLPTTIPDLSLPPLPSVPSGPQPTVTTEVTVTADPGPAPTVTETITVSGAPLPAPTVTHTVSAGPAPTVTISVTPDPGVGPTVTADPGAQPTVTVTVTENVTPEASESTVPTASPSASPSVSPSEPGTPETGDESGSSWWPWLVAGALALALLVVWSTAGSRKRAWRRRLAEAQNVATWAEGTVVPQLLSDADASHATTQWAQARGHVEGVESSLYELHGQARDEASATLATQGLHSMQALRAAVDAEFTPGASTDADAVRARRADLEAARSQVREWLAAASK